jgi:hypothetical protein
MVVSVIVWGTKVSFGFLFGCLPVNILGSFSVLHPGIAPKIQRCIFLFEPEGSSEDTKQIMSKKMTGPTWTPEQLRFIEWCAIPKYERMPPTQAMLAEQMHTHEENLSRWKRIDGFYEAVTAAYRANLVEYLPSIYGALLRKAEEGHFEHIKLVLELTGEYTKTQKNLNQQDGDVTFRFVVSEAAPARLPPLALPGMDADDDD